MTVSEVERIAARVAEKLIGELRDEANKVFGDALVNHEAAITGIVEAIEAQCEPDESALLKSLTIPQVPSAR